MKLWQRLLTGIDNMEEMKKGLLCMLFKRTDLLVSGIVSIVAFVPIKKPSVPGVKDEEEVVMPTG
ncbi:MAG: hypothetical protein M3270_06175 [Thermoproteota archaeon]|nr:hypothetical protein [Thermoproteota archaeon]